MTELGVSSAGNKCRKCGSEEIIPKAKIDMSETGAFLRRGFWRGAIRSGIIADVCGICGYMELYAKEPEHMRKAYLKLRAKEK
jgi:ribosomal protein L40E